MECHSVDSVVCCVVQIPNCSFGCLVRGSHCIAPHKLINRLVLRVLVRPKMSQCPEGSARFEVASETAGEVASKADPTLGIFTQCAEQLQSLSLAWCLPKAVAEATTGGCGDTYPHNAARGSQSIRCRPQRGPNSFCRMRSGTS